MAEEFVKVDSENFKQIKEVEVSLNVKELTSKKARLEQDIENTTNQITRMEAEIFEFQNQIAECDRLIAEAGKLGVKVIAEEVIEP